MLAVAPHTAYIHEPFNIGIKIGVTHNLFKNTFQYVCEENSDPYKLRFDRVINYKYPLASNLSKLKTVRDAAKIVGDQALFLLHKINNNIPIVKDPIALFSAEWLSKTFDMNVLIMIRHPAAFCSSLKIMNWNFDFNNFLKQPLLMETYLGKFESEIREYAENKKNIVDQAILLWNCFHHTISIYQKNHPEWLFMRHEDLSIDPLHRFRSIYEEFGLEFTHQSKLMILKSSSDHNPSERQKGNKFLRNSKENINNWKNRLNQYEIDLIKAKTSMFSSSFYAENEW